MSATRTPTTAARQSWMNRLSSLLGLGGEHRPSTAAAARKKVRLGLEVLEDRRTPTTAAWSGGVLSITGSDSAEAIVARQANGVIQVTDGNNSKILINGYYTGVYATSVSK